MKTLYARAGATAIAAVLALSSTQLSAQEAPTTTEPAAATTPTPAPVPDAAPATATPDPLAPVTIDTSSTATPVHKATARHTTPVKKTAAAPARTVRAPAQPPEAATTAAATVPEALATPEPVVAAPEPTVAPIPPVAQSNADNLDTMMEIGGGALALLVVGGGTALVLRRRRRRAEEEQEMAWTDDTPVEPELADEPRHDPIFDNQPAVYAPSASAFGWGNTHPAAQATDDESDRRPGETWVERAYRGPSPANPSVSLKARLKRAVFFDKREREVAEGTAVAVDPGAGLPDNLDESSVDTPERDLQVA